MSQRRPRLVTGASSCWLALACSGALACGSSDAPPAQTVPPKNAGNGTKTAGTNPDGGASNTNDPNGGDPLVGLWKVEGEDPRGSYAGEVEVRSVDGAYAFVRNVRYAGVTVETDRQLHWLFRGKLTKTGNAVALDSSLKRRDFIVKRGALERQKTDGPIAVTGSLTLNDDGTIAGKIAGEGIDLSDTWSARQALPAKPIFEDKRVLVDAHDPFSATDKQLWFGMYSGFHDLEVVKPYVNRAEFKAAVHGHWIDTTDLEFYRQNFDALRVIDKPVDEISIAETRTRADAYRYTLAKKAELYDRDMETRFIDPALGMVPDSGAPGAGYAGQSPSGDGALWTGIYLASQVFRHQVTGSAVAKENVVRSLNALLTLQEITNDWTKFARVLRKPTGDFSDGWHPGTGPFAHLEWKEGGNNDMIKGLFYGYLLGWELLCEGGKTGHESLCERIRTNAKHLADDVTLGGSNAPLSQLTNKLPAAWLAAVVAEDAGDKLSYQTKASTYWAVGKTVLAQTADGSFQGKVDGSGVHLGSVGDLVAVMLAKRMNLSGDAAAGYRESIDKGYSNLARYRLPEWDLLAAIAGSDAGNPTKVAALVANAVSRLQETTYPKLSYNIDRRISDEFCMSPFPTHPWKGDWMQYPTSDRTTGLRSYPLFESGVDILYWKLNNNYSEREGYEPPAHDYLHLYWQARKYNLLTAAE